MSPSEAKREETWRGQKVPCISDGAHAPNSNLFLGYDDIPCPWVL